jgi:hypothetical protein
MIISDMNYLESISEDVNGAGAAALLAKLSVNVDAQSDAAAEVTQTGYTSAQTGRKIVFYSSSVDLLGLT